MVRLRTRPMGPGGGVSGRHQGSSPPLGPRMRLAQPRYGGQWSPGARRADERTGKQRKGGKGAGA